MKISPKRLLLILSLLAAVVFATAALRPQPVTIETARAVRGPLRVTVDEEGETRVRQRYVLGAPVAGRLERIALDEGDAVKAGQVVARLDPLPLGGHDPCEQPPGVGVDDVPRQDDPRRLDSERCEARVGQRLGCLVADADLDCRPGRAGRRQQADDQRGQDEEGPSACAQASSLGSLS